MFFSFSGIKGEKGTNGTNGTAAGFGTPVASVDANTGTPAVTVTASGPDTAKVLNFAFKNLKGIKGDKGETGPQGIPGTTGPQGPKGDAFKYTDFTQEQLTSLKGPKGDQGEAGAAAGFGTPTATINDAYGTPSVTITTSGTNAEKIFNFNFKNLKGEPGTKGKDASEVKFYQITQELSDAEALKNEDRLVFNCVVPTIDDPFTTTSSDGSSASDWEKIFNWLETLSCVATNSSSTTGSTTGAFGTTDDLSNYNDKYYPANGLITLTYNMFEQNSTGEPARFSPLSGFYSATDLDSDIINLLTPNSEFVNVDDTTVVEQKIRAPIFGIVVDNSSQANIEDKSLGILFTYDIITQCTRNALNDILSKGSVLTHISEDALKALLPYMSFQTTKAIGIY